MVEIIPSVAAHCRLLDQTIRPEDLEEAIRLGLDPKKSTFYAYRRAVYRKTALVNGKVAAMWGVIGTPLGNHGVPYLITGTEALKVSPMKFAKIYISELKTMNHLFPILQNYVDAQYKPAVRLLKIAGFTLEGPVMLNNFPFYKFTLGQV